MKQVMFFRYHGHTLAINHSYAHEENGFAILPIKECSQYSEYKWLMDAVAEELQNKKDGKWLWEPCYGWEHYLLSFNERLACELAVTSD